MVLSLFLFSLKLSDFLPRMKRKHFHQYVCYAPVADNGTKIIIISIDSTYGNCLDHKILFLSAILLPLPCNVSRVANRGMPPYGLPSMKALKAAL